MKKYLLFFLMAQLTITASSQKVFFMYLQAEPEQAFFLKMNGKIHSSSATGYLILPRLYDSTYSFAVGFPQDKWPEQQFTVKMGQRDHGFLLKNFGEKGWGLFDLQSLTVQYSTSVPVKAEVKPQPEKKEVSPFTDLLSKATGDPSLREKPVMPKAEEKPVEKAEVVLAELPPKETPKAETKEVVINKPATETIVEKKEEPKQAVKEPESIKPAGNKELTVVKEEKKEELKPVLKEPETIRPVENKELATVKEEKKEEPKPVVNEPELAKSVQTAVITEVKPDSTVQQKPAEQELKKEEAKALTSEPVAEPLKTAEASGETGYKKAVVTKRSESSTTEGFGLVFMDSWEGGVIDTIRLLIPNPKPVVPLVKEEPKEEKKFLDIAATAVKPEEKPVEEKPVPEEKAKPAAEKPVGEEKAKPAGENKPVEEKPVMEEKARPVDEKKTMEEKPKPEEPAVKPASKTGLPVNCSAVAEEADFFALRKIMAAAEGDDEMISQAKKYFKQKCFTVPQIKNLASLFLNDEAKYNFFDAAYKYVTDKAAFVSLETELKDPYFINRFKAMIQ
ncbi:MAG: hypothetical protein HZA79_09510 [Sphingobacteriales bacterium]|nr:hypothetical protein [Sphingobacteriales bacterium]